MFPRLGEPGQLFCHMLGGDGCTSQGWAVIRGGGRRKRRANVWEAHTFSLPDARHSLSYLILTTMVSLRQFTVEGLRLNEGQQCVNTANNRDSNVDQFDQSIKQKMTADLH